MSIKFFCSCGKPLRARDEMAARRSVCPRCGAPVGIPSLRPTHAGTDAAPLTPQERRHRPPVRPTEDDAADATQAITVPPWNPFVTVAKPEVIITTTVRPCDPFKPPPSPILKPRPRRLPRPRQLERGWDQCLLYPWLSRRLLGGLALALTVLSSSAALMLPHMPGWPTLSWPTFYSLSPFLLMAGLLLPYVCGTLECALMSALAGQGPETYWPGWNFVSALRTCGRWLVCFLAWPVVPASLGVYYWVQGGVLSALDWLIVGELFVFAVAYWFLAVVKANESRNLGGVAPGQIARLIRRLRYRAAVPVLLVPAVLTAHFLVMIWALEELHESPFWGWLLLALCWGSGLFWATFLFRLMGVWCYRSPKAPSEWEADAPPAVQGPVIGLG